MNIDECPICLDSMKNKFVIKTPCMHEFCMKCFINMDKQNCPICRKSFIDNTQNTKYLDNFIFQQKNNNIVNDIDFPPL